MKNVLFALILAASGFAQTAQPKPVTKPQSSCTVALKATSQAADAMSAELANLRAERDKLKAENEKLALDSKAAQARVDDVSQQRDNIKSIAVNLLQQDAQEYSKLVAANSALVDKYNDLLQRANNLINAQNARLARQQQVNNALAVYGMLPKYQPPQTVNVNVSDCNKNPALCVH